MQRAVKITQAFAGKCSQPWPTCTPRNKDASGLSGGNFHSYWTPFVLFYAKITHFCEFGQSNYLYKVLKSKKRYNNKNLTNELREISWNGEGPMTLRIWKTALLVAPHSSV